VPGNASAEISVLSTDLQKVNINGEPSSKFRSENGEIIFKAAPCEYEFLSIKSINEIAMRETSRKPK